MNGCFALGGEHHGTVVEAEEGLPVIQSVLRFPLVNKVSPIKDLGPFSFTETEEERYVRHALRYSGIGCQHNHFTKRWDFFVHESVMSDPDAFENVDVFVINQLVSIAMTKGHRHEQLSNHLQARRRRLRHL